MDVIDTIDWGAYAHFAFVASSFPGSVRFMQTYYTPISYGVIISLVAVVMLLFALQKRIRALLVTSMGLVATLGLIEVCRMLVPRLRPSDAREMVGAQNMIGSYPSAGVFLYMLVMIYFGFALWPHLRPGMIRSLYLIAAVLSTIGVAMSQFLLATNYVSDVVGAIVGAALMGYVVSRFIGPANQTAPNDLSTEIFDKNAN